MVRLPAWFSRRSDYEYYNYEQQHDIDGMPVGPFIVPRRLSRLETWRLKRAWKKQWANPNARSAFVYDPERREFVCVSEYTGGVSPQNESEGG